MSTKHTPGLTRTQVLAAAEKYGAFEYGDAQGDKRLQFAADVIAKHERIRNSAQDLLEALDTIAGMYDYEASVGDLASRLYDARCIAQEAIRNATGGAT